MNKPTGLELAKEKFGKDIPQCDDCNQYLGTNVGCMTCMYAYDTRLEQWREENA